MVWLQKMMQSGVKCVFSVESIDQEDTDAVMHRGETAATSSVNYGGTKSETRQI
jgi:hypothetical protein